MCVNINRNEWKESGVDVSIKNNEGNPMSNFIKKQVLFVGIMSCLISLVFMGVLGGFFLKFNLSEQMADTFARIVISGGILWFTWRIGLLCKQEYEFTQFGEKLRIGWVMYIVQGLLLIMAVCDIKGEVIRPQLSTIIKLILSNMVIGFFEEVLMRGLIFKHMWRAWQDKKYGLQLAVFISSILFGIIHIINLLANPSLVVATSVQVIYAVFGGIYFSVLYIKTKNIWVPILLHGVIDIISGIANIVMKNPIGIHEISLQKGLLQLVMIAPLAIWGVVCLHKISKETRSKEN